MELVHIIYMVSLMVVIIITIIVDKKKNKNYQESLDLIKSYHVSELKFRYEIGFASGKEYQKSKSWSNFIFSNTETGLKAYINGKEVVVAQVNNCNTIGFWYLDGHTFKGFGSKDIFDEAFAQKMYGRDYKKIMADFDIKPPEEDFKS